MEDNPRAMPTAALETRDLTKSYGPATALAGLTLSVQPGEVFGFLGPNGAGKTTTIRLLLDLIRPTRGDPLLFGRPVGEAAARARVGYLPGELSMDERLRGDEMLVLLDDLRAPDQPPADRRWRGELCERLRLGPEDLSRPLRASSRGTKQKFGLIAAMQHDPDLWILDEPTTGLDPLVREEVLALFTEAGARGRTVFHSSHVMTEVERTCDRVAVLRHGELVVLDTTEALRRRLVRRMIVRFADTAPADELTAAGARVVEADGPRVVLAVTGALDPLLAVLARHPVEHLVFPEPELDEAFLHLFDGAPA